MASSLRHDALDVLLAIPALTSRRRVLAELLPLVLLQRPARRWAHNQRFAARTSVEAMLRLSSDWVLHLSQNSNAMVAVDGCKDGGIRTDTSLVSWSKGLRDTNGFGARVRRKSGLSIESPFTYSSSAEVRS